MANLWDRQPLESLRAYEHFMAWVQHATQVQDATLAGFAREHNVAANTVYRYSREWNWRERANAYLACHSHHLTDPNSTDLIPTIHTSPDEIRRITDARLGLAERRVKLAEHRVALAERAAGITDRLLTRIDAEDLPDDDEIRIKLLSTLTKIIGDALPREVILDTAAGSITSHPEWDRIATAITAALAPYPDAVEALTDLLRASTDTPHIVDAEVIP